MTSLALSTSVAPAARLRGRLEVPADKSIGHRALIVDALSGGPAALTMRSPGRDLLSTVACLRALGVSVDEEVDNSVTTFTLSGAPAHDATLDCGNSGTTMRLLAGALAGLPLTVTLDGDGSLRARPMERVAALLRATGADALTVNGHAPITVSGRRALVAVRHRLPVASAQLVGTASLAALSAPGETTIASPGTTRDHTERMLAAAGIDIRRDRNETKIVGPAVPRALSMIIPGDFSSAAPWLVAAAIHPDADISIHGVGVNPSRMALIGLLQRMGAGVTATITDDAGPEPIGEIRAHGGKPLRAVTIEGADVAPLIDELPLVGIAMAAADGTSELRDAGELRVKESDRITATVAGLRAIGASVDELPDGWRVSRGTPRAARIATHGDHRIAIAFAIAAMTGVAGAVELDDAECVSVSYPGFWNDLATVAE